jgi:hypothetical protein
MGLQGCMTSDVCSQSGKPRQLKIKKRSSMLGGTKKKKKEKITIRGIVVHP